MSNLHSHHPHVKAYITATIMSDLYSHCHHDFQTYTATTIMSNLMYSAKTWQLLHNYDQHTVEYLMKSPFIMQSITPSTRVCVTYWELFQTHELALTIQFAFLTSQGIPLVHTESYRQMALFKDLLKRKNGCFEVY